MDKRVIYAVRLADLGAVLPQLGAWECSVCGLSEPEVELGGFTMQQGRAIPFCSRPECIAESSKSSETVSDAR